MDLENSVNFRLQYLPDSDRVTTLAYSAMDENWANEIEAGKDMLFIIEGLSMYLTEKENREILRIIDDNFDSCTIFTEIMPPVSVENTKEVSVEETNSEFIWGLKKGSELTRLNNHFKWIRDVNLFDGVNVYRPIFRLFTWFPLLRKRMDYIAVLEK